MKVWVVMGNDYPDSVFATERLAEDYIAERKKRSTPMIYWRAYEFTVHARTQEIWRMK